MGKLWMMLAVMATLAPIMAQDSAPAPEATAQETCEIAEKDVDTMMDEYIASKGWNEGLNEKNGKKFFVAKGTGVIQAPRESASYIGSRVNAYNKAMLEAKKAMVEYLGVDIATETTKEYAEGSAVNPPPPTEGEEVAGKLKKLLISKLNKTLAEEGIDPVKDPAAARAALGKQLNSESYKKLITSMAHAKVMGMQAACTFEGTPKSDKGEIGVVSVWSPKLQSMAASMVTGAPVPKVGAKKPISEQVTSDPMVLLSTFGVQQRIDENGDLVLVAFGQAGAVSESKMSINAAKGKAKQNAMAALREFAGEQVAVASDTLNAESTAEFEKGAEIYSDESAFREKIAAVAGKMNIAGAAPLRNAKAKHPINGKTVTIVALTWNPKQADIARMLKMRMENPHVPNGPKPPAPVVKPPRKPDEFNNCGDGADPDAV